MIQSLLFFALGFLSAAFLALIIAPAIWRRAVVLTRRRIEATVPMTLNEIQAEKDRLRADMAMAVRRLEMKLHSAQEKLAVQAVELGRNHEELKFLSEECAAKSKTIGELEAQASDLHAHQRKREDETEKLFARAADAERRLEERAAELERLERELEETAFASSNRQIELVARETEIDKLTGDVNILRSQLRETEKRAREIASENKASQEALRAERKRLAELEKKLERMTSSASDGQERLERREKELARLREDSKRSFQSVNELRARLTETEKERDRLQAQVSELSQRAATTPAGDKVVAGNTDSGSNAAERARLEERLTALVRENKKLRADLSASAQEKPREAEDGALRDQIQVLAAEMVNLTANLEGPDSPIRAALAQPGPGGAAAGMQSLADRIRALQKAKPALSAPQT